MTITAWVLAYLLLAAAVSIGWRNVIRIDLRRSILAGACWPLTIAAFGALALAMLVTAFMELITETVNDVDPVCPKCGLDLLPISDEHGRRPPCPCEGETYEQAMHSTHVEWQGRTGLRGPS